MPLSTRKKPIGVAAVLLLLLLLGGGLLMLRGCDSVPGIVSETKIVPEKLTILYTCDTRGHIEPCSCSEGEAGGMDRRQTHLVKLETGPNPLTHRLLVDAGNVTAGPREWEILEARYILQAYEMMGYDAVNLGATEVSLSADKLRELVGHFGGFVSTNVVDKSGQPLCPPSRIVTLPDTGGYTIGILGIVDDTVPPQDLGEGVRILPPEDILPRHLPDLRKKSDLVVLLAFASEERMKALAERFYEIDVIVGGDVLQPSGTPDLANRSTIVYITDKGKGVGRLDLAPGPQGLQLLANDIKVLVEETPPNPDMSALIEKYHADLAEAVGDEAPNLHDDEEGLTNIRSTRNPNADTFAGADACKGCHPKAYDAWAASGHTRAYEALARRDGQSNPDCLPCHTVGYGASDGFVSAALTPQLGGVTCESCHGRGAHHARLEAGEEVNGPVIGFRTVECVVCHDTENSPRFDRAVYWEKIAHGLG